MSLERKMFRLLVGKYVFVNFLFWKEKISTFVTTSLIKVKCDPQNSVIAAKHALLCLL